MTRSCVGSLVTFCLTVFLFLPTVCAFTHERLDSTENATPIVGILTQEVSHLVQRHYPQKNFTSYIAASYVKFVEGAGARVVPIWIGQSREYYADILSKVNGVLLPGGATYFNQSGGYADAGYFIYEIALKMNQQGTYFPVWGTCLGFELLTYVASNRTEHRSHCASNQQPLPLEFAKGFEKSKMFANAPSDIISILATQPVTANFHQYCITEQTLSEYGLDQDWRYMSFNHDWNDFEFISTIEHKNFPFYGVQFHPEKVLYEFIQNRSIPHSKDAVQASQYFADFFVDETRKNHNKFSSRSEERDSLIYNYSPEYTGRLGSAFMQQYLFEGSVARTFHPQHFDGTYAGETLNSLDVEESDVVITINKYELK